MADSTSPGANYLVGLIRELLNGSSKTASASSPSTLPGGGDLSFGIPDGKYVRLRLFVGTDTVVVGYQTAAGPNLPWGAEQLKEVTGQAAVACAQRSPIPPIGLRLCDRVHDYLATRRLQCQMLVVR